MVSQSQTTLGRSTEAPDEPSRWLDHLLAGRAAPLAQAAFAHVSAHAAEPVVRDALGVAHILADLDLDDETLAAAILHMGGDEALPKAAETETRFGAGVARLLAGVQRMDWIREHGGAARSRAADAEGLRKMLLAMAEDMRVVFIKLASRLHRLRGLKGVAPEEAQRVARETLDLFAPLANRLGIWQVKWELEDLALRYLEPETYKDIAKRLSARRIERERYLERVVDELGQELRRQGVAAEVSSRSKHIYSIWKKMQRKGVDFDQIFDVFATRVLVDSVADCYAALGIVHGLWPHIPKEFDDYIANPKRNQYRSLHTAVVGPDGRVVEVQIRTREMHAHAELGVAAHWSYKEGGRHDEGVARKVNWLRQVLDWKGDVADAGEVVGAFESETAEDRVYVFTPQGRIIDLPHGATVLDFAYHVHTEVGHRCRGAKVDGRMVPLQYRLQTAQQVEILTAKQGGPSRDWLNPSLGYLHTTRAIGKVRAWFAQQDQDNNIAAGRTTLERELARTGLHGVNYERLAEKLRFAGVNDMLAAIGRGDVGGGQILHAVSEAAPAAEPEMPVLRPARPTELRDAVTIQGVGNLLTTLGRCCRPVPPDPIVGYVTRGRGVTIHRADCRNALNLRERQAQRVIEVSWGNPPSAGYPVDIQISSYDRTGLLRDVSSLLANERINVIAVNSATDKSEHMAHMNLTIEIADIPQLGRVLARIAALPNVLDVRRRG